MFRSCASRADVPGTADPGGRAVRGRPTGSRPSRVATADRHRLHPSADCPLPGAGPRADGRRDRGARRRRRAVSRPGRATTLNTKQRTHTPPPRRRAPAHPRTTARRYTRTRATRGGAQGDCGGHHTATPSPRLTGPDTRSGSRVPRTPTVLPASTYAATGYTYSASCRLTLTSGRSVSATHALCPCYSQCLLSKLSVYSLSSAASTF